MYWCCDSVQYTWKQLFIWSFIIWNIAINNCWLRINSYVQNSQWWYMVYISHGMHKLWYKDAEFFLFYWLFPYNVFWSWFPTPVPPRSLQPLTSQLERFGTHGNERYSRILFFGPPVHKQQHRYLILVVNINITWCIA